MSSRFHGTNHAIQIGTNHGSVKAEFHRPHATEDIDKLCVQCLRCPNSLAVKNRLKETKDGLLRESFEWVLQDPNYLRWRSGKDVCLLWIKGGAGQGKTMMSIGLIEELCQEEKRRHSVVVTYFFCQNADNELNTLESLIKGLILRLVNQRVELKESLRRRWDSKNGRFDEDITSWRTLWNILLEMLDRCGSGPSKTYIVVDALDECQDRGMTDFLKLIVRHGLDRPSKIKWLLTSRPLKAAESALLLRCDQLQLSLDLNQQHISQSVQNYISFKVNELSQQNTRKYGKALIRKVKNDLSAKTGGTFLWVSLVCKRLEGVHPDNVLAMIQDLPPGLHPFYERILHQLNTGDTEIVRQHMRLLKVMMLAFRPLKVEELPNLIDLASGDDRAAIKELVDRCASFVKMRDHNLEFVHQSARDYLARGTGLAILESYETRRFGHYDIVLRCLNQLSEHLRVNLMDLPRPNSTQESWLSQKDKGKMNRLSSLAYAATFWVRHLQNAPETTLAEEGPVAAFLQEKLLEWLECLSLLDRLPGALVSLQQLVVERPKGNPSISALAQDAFRLLKRHYGTVARWPLQIYSSALFFSPEASLMRAENSNKVPNWVRQLSPTESTWTPLLQTLKGHRNMVKSVIFSPDGTQIASISEDIMIKVWDTATGNLQRTLEGHLSTVSSVAFSPDGAQIASGSRDKTIKLWDATTGNLQRTLEGHSNGVTTVAFSPDGALLASGSRNGTIELWDTTTGNLQKTFEDQTGHTISVAFLPSGTQIISGSFYGTIKLWDITPAGRIQRILEGHSGLVNSMVFLPTSKLVSLCSLANRTIKIWDITTGHLQKTIEGCSSIAFSPDGTQIATNCQDYTIKLWDSSTGHLQKTLNGHLNSVSSLAFSPNGTQIVSGCRDGTLKLWDPTANLDEPQESLKDHTNPVKRMAFSPDGTCIASMSSHSTVKLWDFTTGHLRKTMHHGHEHTLDQVAFSPDGTLIASASQNHGSITVWDTTTGNLQMAVRPRGALSSMAAIAFSPNGHKIALSLMNGTIEIWDMDTGDLQKTLKGLSRWVFIRAVAFSSGGTHIAASSSKYYTTDNSITVWHITKVSKASKLLGERFTRSLHLGPQKKIKTSRPAESLEFSADGRCLITDIGLVGLENTVAEQHMHNIEPNSLQRLSVEDQWICYGKVPIVRLQSDVQVVCLAVNGDRLAIGVDNGQVWRFVIDRRALHSMLEFSPARG